MSSSCLTILIKKRTSVEFPSRKMAIYKLGSGSFPDREPDCVYTLISDFNLQKCEKQISDVYKPSSLCCFRSGVTYPVCHMFYAAFSILFSLPVWILFIGLSSAHIFLVLLLIHLLNLQFHCKTFLFQDVYMTWKGSTSLIHFSIISLIFWQLFLTFCLMIPKSVDFYWAKNKKAFYMQV